jgi:plastocyanin
MARIAVTVVAVLAVVSAVGLALAQEAVQVGMGTPVVWTADATPATTATTISIVNNPDGDPTARYQPETLEIAVGTTVIWTNIDNSIEDNLHTATSDDTVADGDFVFDSGVLDEGISYAHTFNTAGTFEYRCLFHDDMTGTVRVA